MSDVYVSIKHITADTDCAANQINIWSWLSIGLLYIYTYIHDHIA